jgi:hypothetical protein
MFFRKSVILMWLLVAFVQEFDSKPVVFCAREVAEPAVWSEAGSSEVAAALSAAAAR